MLKRIVICADGTWNRPEKDPQKEWPTNVLRMARAIKSVADDGAVQQVFYDWGVGSYHDAMYAGITGQGVQRTSWTHTAISCRTTRQATSCSSSASVGARIRSDHCAE